ncbi:MAG TPA: protein-S-isoprenylcysteine O-methyltransferase [Xanthobacteraceae bacterium]|nr:protein-S-isoprenylcysteine O-methyltransferase [Xanthobacteraceae bacterium]
MTPTISKIIWLAFMIAWAVLRQQPGHRSRKTPVSYSGRDIRERLLMAASFTGLGIIPSVYLAFHFPRFADYPFMPVLTYLGIAVDVACLWLFYRTHHDLGKNWSVSLDLRERHTLVTSGVYAHVRHPMYSAFWLMALAQALLLPNWIAGLSGFVGFGILFFGRVGREEEMMMQGFGEEYRTYMAHTARVVPWIY